MTANDLFSPGLPHESIPATDPTREAVNSLRGYAYQAIASALAWTNLNDVELLFLEVAEDYAIVAGRALRTTQVKNTDPTQSVTLNSTSIRSAIASFVAHVERNPHAEIQLRFVTTSRVGTERALADRPSGIAGLEYWRKAFGQSARVDITPLRAILQSARFPDSVRSFCTSRNDEELRRELIARIHWDCGNPSFSRIRRQLEATLVLLGRDRFRIPSDEAHRIADHLIYRVLHTCTRPEPDQRVLTRADLYSAIDSASRLSIPRAHLDRLVEIASRGAPAPQSEEFNKPLSNAQPWWLVPGYTIRHVPGTIPRTHVETALSSALTHYGTAIFVGGNGLGKSTVAYSVARALPGEFNVVQFRYANPDETIHRLDFLLGCMACLGASTMILDDLSYFEHQGVRLSIARVLESTDRHNCNVIITSSRAPSATELTGARIESKSVIECPYFTAAETRALVLEHGGSPNILTRFAHAAGAFGHPQLTHAFVIAAAARGWPAEETDDILQHGLLSRDVTAARRSAAQDLMHTVPEHARELLYRLSVTIGRFSKAIAFAVGKVPPAVPRVGESFTQLVGPWIESVGDDHYHVSPLASNLGREMLSSDLTTLVHRSIARAKLAGRTIAATEGDTILLHALYGKCQTSLLMLAQSILSANESTLKSLADHFSLFLIYRTDTPIFLDDAYVSGMLRIAQFKIAVVAGRNDKLSSIASALFREIDQVSDPGRRNPLESKAALTVLTTVGIANHVVDWIERILRFKNIATKNRALRKQLSTAERDAGTRLSSALFSIGITGLTSVDRLESIVDALAKLKPRERTAILRPIDPKLSDYSEMIAGPWLEEHRSNHLNAADASIRYQRIAGKTIRWGIPELPVQCILAQSVILDEHLNNATRALSVLNEGTAKIGFHPLLSRAIANIHSNRGEHHQAHAIFLRIQDSTGRDNPIERAFTLRAAAMNAARIGEWSQATAWFRQAECAARLIETADMAPIAIGLHVDSAVSSLESGAIAVAISTLAETLDELPSIAADESLRSAYCHRVVRHTVLWVYSRLTGTDLEVEGQPVRMEPGTCSNPNPMEAIRDLPLGSLDLAWYMLAAAEVAGGTEVRIATTLNDRLTGAPIPVMEFELRTKVIQKAIESLDADYFVAQLVTYVECAAYIIKDRGQISNFDPLSPRRAVIPSLGTRDPLDAVALSASKDAIIAFTIAGAMLERDQAITELRSSIQSGLSSSFPGLSILDEPDHSTQVVTRKDVRVLNDIRHLYQNGYVNPERLWTISYRIFDWATQSNFERVLTNVLCQWMRTRWSTIVRKQAFRFIRPWHTIPAINDTLMDTANDRCFCAKLLVVTADAIDLTLSSEFRIRLKTIARERTNGAV